MKRSSFALRSLMSSVLGIAACGGSAQDGTTPGGGGGGGGGGKPAAAGDVTLEIPVVKIEGLVFEPEALGRPGMPIYAPKNPNLTVAQQKKIFGAEKDPVAKQAQGAVLASMLYKDSKTAPEPQQKQLITEARDVLKTAAAYAKGKVDEVTLRLLGSYEILLEDWPAAEQAWAGLVELGSKAQKKPTDLLEHKAWWIYTLLTQGKNAEAATVAKADPPVTTQPLHAYAVAWARWRAGDDAGAWQAMALAGEGWGQNGNQPALERDVFLFASRSKAPREQVVPSLYKIFGATKPEQQYEVLSKLGQQAYQYAGRWTDAVAAVEDAFKLIGAKVPPPDKMRLKYWVAEFLVRIDQPDAAARNAKEAIAAMPACTACNAKEKDSIVQLIYGIARTMHLLYATANDVRFFQPAHDIYVEVIPLIQDNALRTQAKSDLDTLEKTLKNTKVGTGTHDKQAIGVLLGRHTQEVQACYEAQLALNPKLAGQLTLELESDASGAIKGSTSEPKAGTADLAAVAGCSANAAKEWKLPKRGMAGNTRIKLVYNLVAKK